MFNKLLIRIVALLLHAFLNFLLVNWLLNFDLSGSWVKLGLFLLLLVGLLILFIKHFLSFLQFLKYKS